MNTQLKTKVGGMVKRKMESQEVQENSPLNHGAAKECKPSVENKRKIKEKKEKNEKEGCRIKV